jgi:glutamine phosphoribosylpyrophosphate amidotransferase
MCGVIGVSLDNVTPYQVSLVRRVMKETQIRGLHASGVAYHDGRNLVCTKLASPITELADRIHWEAVAYTGNLKMIAHARYSTSDMEFHQPLGDEEMYIAHNGVITQEPPETWRETYGYDFNTRNDSEILLQKLSKEGEASSVINGLNGSSIAFVSIDRDGIVSGYRNTLRPLWRTQLSNGFILTSTKDIMMRASEGIWIPEKVEPTGSGQDYQIR